VPRAQPEFGFDFAIAYPVWVSSLLTPKGPAPASVYWRRRVVVLAVLFVVILLLGKACSGGDDKSASAPSALVPQTSPADISPSVASTDAARQDAAGTTSPTLSPTPTTASGPIKCKNSQVRVYVTANDPQNSVGGPVLMRYVIATNSDVKCLRDVGGTQDELTITSTSGKRIWSSDDCNPGGAPNIKPISKSSPFAVTVEWGGSITKPGCPSTKPIAPAGTYQIVGRNGNVYSTPEPLTLG